MNKEYTAIIKQEGDWWIGWIEEISGINCQEHSHKDLIKSLKATLKEAIEFNRKDAVSAVKTGYVEERITL